MLSHILKLSLVSGLSLGLVASLYDLGMRILLRHFEWFDPYLSLISNVPLFVLGTFMLTLLFAPLLLLFQSRWVKEDYSSLYLSFVIVLTICILVQVVIQSVLYDLSDDWPESRIQLTLLGLFVPALLGIVLFRTRDRFLQLLLRKWKAGSGSSLAGNGLFFLIVFCLACLGLDFYQLQVVPMPVHRSDLDHDAPNVVFITLDTVRADHLEPYGYSKPTTPFLKELASSSIVFEQATSTSPWTLPAHASMFTGLSISDHRAHMEHQKLDESFETLAEKLAEHGYSTAGFVSGPYCLRKYGLSQGFHYYHDRLDFFEWRHTPYLLNARKLVQLFFPDFYLKLFGADGERIAHEVNADAVKWLDKNAAGPFFLFLNYFDAHSPYTLGRESLDMFTKLPLSAAEVNMKLDAYAYSKDTRYKLKTESSDFIEFAKALYDTEIRFLDAQVEKLVSYVENLSTERDTVFVITSDHGEEFFEHGGVYHGETLYTEVLHVPLILTVPGIPAARVQTRVSTQDLFYTILELAGIDLSDAEREKSLLRDVSEVREHTVLSERFGRAEHSESGLKAVTSGNWKLIEVEPVQERIPNSLYDLLKDPLETYNIYNENSEKRESLEALLE